MTAQKAYAILELSSDIMCLLIYPKEIDVAWLYKNKADILSYFGYFANRNFGENGV